MTSDSQPSETCLYALVVRQGATSAELAIGEVL
jgi:hypothetical protein